MNNTKSIITKTNSMTGIVLDDNKVPVKIRGFIYLGVQNEDYFS